MLDTIKVNQFIEFSLENSRRKIEEHLEGEAMFIYGPIDRGLDDAVRADIEALKIRKEKLSKRLVVVIETLGGYVEIVERICNVLRHNFEIVDFIIPNHAYSAGTVLVLSGDKIYMDYYSILGPIDPQRVNSEGQLIPGTAYLHEFDELIKKNRKRNLTQAELFFLVKNFDPAEMFVVKQAREHSKELIKKWLVEYKFKNWKITKTKKKKVTLTMKKERAENIAKYLGDPLKWRSHARGITMQELRSEKIRLIIDDYGKDEKLNESIHQYYDLLKDYYRKIDARLALHSANGFTRLA